MWVRMYMAYKCVFTIIVMYIISGTRSNDDGADVDAGNCFRIVAKVVSDYSCDRAT